MIKTFESNSIRLRGSWDASCEFEVSYNGRKYVGTWSATKGYQISNNSRKGLSVEESEQLDDFLRDLESPTISFDGCKTLHL